MLNKIIICIVGCYRWFLNGYFLFILMDYFDFILSMINFFVLGKKWNYFMIYDISILILYFLSVFMRC